MQITYIAANKNKNEQKYFQNYHGHMYIKMLLQKLVHSIVDFFFQPVKNKQHKNLFLIPLTKETSLILSKHVNLSIYDFNIRMEIKIITKMLCYKFFSGQDQNQNVKIVSKLLCNFRKLKKQTFTLGGAGKLLSLTSSNRKQLKSFQLGYFFRCGLNDFNKAWTLVNLSYQVVG